MVEGRGCDVNRGGTHEEERDAQPLRRQKYTMMTHILWK